MSTRLRLGTRGSPLALAQATQVKASMESLEDGLVVELVVIKTSGDRIADRPLAGVGGKGLFVKEIEEALLAGWVDVAVHSMKDLPAELAPGLEIAAVPRREDPGDLLISRERLSIDALPRGARAGTSSLRRMALLRAARGDLDVVPLRGNVDTRLRKLAEGAVDAIVLAVAGVRRLGIDVPGAVRLEAREFTPAVGQGALAIETRGDAVRELAARLDDAETRAAVAAERAFMRRAGGSCVTPLAAHGVTVPEGLRLRGVIASPDGRRVVRGEAAGSRGGAEDLGRRLAEDILDRGGAEILRALEAGR